LLVEPAATTSLEGGRPGDLVLRAQRALEAAVGRPLPARFKLWKRVPAGAGLGGGSSDAAAVLRGLARLYRLDCDLVSIAVGLGADVPFFLRGGAALAEGRGERLRPLPVEGRYYAVVWPGFEISTRSVYAAWDGVGGEGPNQLLRAATAVEPQLECFANRLGASWRMTGSGSAFFRPYSSPEEAERALVGMEVAWAAVARPVQAWEPW
jgi:4-diphosphocytidyl-2C-methyl-D-erythritol kinase